MYRLLQNLFNVMNSHAGKQLPTYLKTRISMCHNARIACVRACMLNLRSAEAI